MVLCCSSTPSKDLGHKPRFVLQKALENGLKLMVVINKIDRPDCRPDEVLSKTFDLLVELGADDETLDFPYIFSSAKEGYAVTIRQHAKEISDHYSIWFWNTSRDRPFVPMIRYS